MWSGGDGCAVVEGAAVERLPSASQRNDLWIVAFFGRQMSKSISAWLAAPCSEQEVLDFPMIK